MKEWLENNKEYKKQKDKEYSEKNKDKKKEYMRQWRANDYRDMKTNTERVDEYINYKVKTNTGRRIREILNQKKSNRCMDYVGCSLEKLKSHLESKFVDGMSWNNYGKYKKGIDKSGWHIDHIIP